MENKFNDIHIKVRKSYFRKNWNNLTNEQFKSYFLLQGLNTVLFMFFPLNIVLFFNHATIVTGIMGLELVRHLFYWVIWAFCPGVIQPKVLKTVVPSNPHKFALIINCQRLITLKLSPLVLPQKEGWIFIP